MKIQVIIYNDKLECDELIGRFNTDLSIDTLESNILKIGALTYEVKYSVVQNDILQLFVDEISVSMKNIHKRYIVL
jgi:hypothetical protein